MLRKVISKVLNKIDNNDSSDVDRRVATRHNQVFIASCYINSKPFTSTIFNVSQTGLGIFLNKQIKENSSFFITVNHEYKDGLYSRQRKNITFPVKMAWTKKNDQNQLNNPLNINKKDYMAGVFFDQLTQESQKDLLSLWESN